MTEFQMTINNLKEVLITGELLLEKMEKAQKDLGETPPHKWEHGDIFETTTHNIMVYLKFTAEPPRTVCIVGRCGGLVEPLYFDETLQDAKFLFNIREKL